MRLLAQRYAPGVFEIFAAHLRDKPAKELHLKNNYI